MKTHMLLKQLILGICFIASSITVVGQEKLNKVSQTIKVDKDVTIDVNTNYVQIDVDTWNKNYVEIEAYVESNKLSKEELKKVMDNWNLDINGGNDYVSISTKGSTRGWDLENIHFDKESMRALRELELGLVDMPDISELPELPAMPELPTRMMELKNMPKIPSVPELPELPEGVNNVNFDYEKYQKEGDTYLKKWSAEYEEKFGKEYREKMEAWAKEFAKTDWKGFEKSMEKWGEEFGEKFGKEYEKEMEEWGKNFGETWGKEYAKRMEAWEQRYGKQMEERAKRQEERAKAIEERMKDREKLMAERQKELAERQEGMAKMRADNLRIRELGKQDVIKTIKIRMPKNAKMKMNVRHGELKLSSVINDLKADVYYATLIADYIDGGNTSINVSYSPVIISNWNQGLLKLNYVDKAKINDVEKLVLFSNSSNVGIGTIKNDAVIEGNFGDLSVSTIANTFKNVKIDLENSDALINLPDINSYKFIYKGTKSRFTHPESKDERITTFNQGNSSSGKTLVINSKFSHVITQ